MAQVPLQCRDRDAKGCGRQRLFGHGTAGTVMLERATYNCAGIELTMGKRWNWVPSLRERSMTAGQLTQTQCDPAYPSLNSIAPIALRSLSLDFSSSHSGQMEDRPQTHAKLKTTPFDGETGAGQGETPPVQSGCPPLLEPPGQGPTWTTRIQMPYRSGCGP